MSNTILQTHKTENLEEHEGVYVWINMKKCVLRRVWWCVCKSTLPAELIKRSHDLKVRRESLEKFPTQQWLSAIVTSFLSFPPSHQLIHDIISTLTQTPPTTFIQILCVLNQFTSNDTFTVLSWILQYKALEHTRC